MRIINFRHYNFRVGKKVLMKKDYIYGLTKILIGEIGIIEDISIEDFPDLGLFGIRILHIKFNNKELHIGDQIAENLMDTI